MLKKICALLAVLISLAVIGSGNSSSVFLGYADKFEVCLSHGSDGQILSVNENQLKFLTAIKGESFKADKNSFDLDAFLSEFNGKILIVERIESGTSYYGYSPKIKYRKNMNGTTINFHVFIGEKTVTVGSPVIYGSF